MTCSDIARDIVWPFVVKQFKLVEAHNEFEDLSFHRSQLKTEKIINRACVYFVVDKGTPRKVLKVGMTSHYRDRLKAYKKQGDVFATDDYTLLRVFDFDNVSAEYNAAAKQNYEDMMKALISSKQLQPLQRRLFEALYTYKEDQLDLQICHQQRGVVAYQISVADCTVCLR